MIKIIDDWYVTAETNPTNYVVRRGSYKKDKDGKLMDKPRGYFHTLRNAVKFIRDQIIAEKHSEGLLTLGDALVTISEVDVRFVEILSKIES